MWNVFEVKSIDQCFLIVFIMISMYYDIPHCYIFNSLPHWNIFYPDIILRPRRVFFRLDRHEFIFERHIFYLNIIFYRDAWHLLNNYLLTCCLCGVTYHLWGFYTIVMSHFAPWESIITTLRNILFLDISSLPWKLTHWG